MDDEEEEFRIEHDSLGEVRVPTDAPWQAQTQRAVENFPVSGRRVNQDLVDALLRIKRGAALVNARLGVIDEARAEAIAGTVDGLLSDEGREAFFPVDLFQTGSGTSTNMNVNEVVATLATSRLGEKVHPNDHVNASQSSNDTFPSAIHVAAVEQTVLSAEGALAELAGAFEAKQREFAAIVKSGRTHLMDAVPMTLGQEFGGYAAAIRLGIDRIHSALPRVCSLPLGGTAVGTGLNAPEGFASAVIELLDADLHRRMDINGLGRRDGVRFYEAVDHFEAQGGRDALVELSGVFRVVAVSLYKIANDLRWLSSGPATGLREIHLPELQPGSSIMPGKVNPVLPEAVQQVVAQVIGNDAAVAFGGAAGTLELNVMMPVIAANLLDSIALVSNVSVLFARRCVVGIEPNIPVLARYAESSPSLVTSLVPLIGYEEAARVAHEAVSSSRTIREVMMELGTVDPDQLVAALDPLPMTRGGVRG